MSCDFMLAVHHIVHCADIFRVSTAGCDPNIHLHEGGQLVEHTVLQLAVGRTCPAGVALCCQGVKNNKGEGGIY